MKQPTVVDSQPRDLLTVQQFSSRYPAWSQPALRNIILNSIDRLNSRGEKISGNGLDPAVFRLGRKVLLSEGGFFAWVAAQQRNGKRAA